MVLTKSQRAILKDSRILHEELIDTIVRHQLYRGLSVFRTNPAPRLARCWPELHFTELGIKECGDYIFCETSCPDVILLTRQPGHLLIVELKLRPSTGALNRLDYQLRTDRDYILEHGTELSQFLESEGVSQGEIDCLEIGFSGVVGLSSKRVREVQYFGLFDN